MNSIPQVDRKDSLDLEFLPERLLSPRERDEVKGILMIVHSCLSGGLNAEGRAQLTSLPNTYLLSSVQKEVLDPVFTVLKEQPLNTKKLQKIATEKLREFGGEISRSPVRTDAYTPLPRGYMASPKEVR